MYNVTSICIISYIFVVYNCKKEVLFQQALPGGEETDFILVSCAGAGVADDESGASSAAALSHKRRGETALRLSGLGYTIVRPGPLLEEPGGYKALVFDQACAPPRARLLALSSDRLQVAA